jgi:hypothetical protein
VILIISVTAIALGVVFGIIKAQKNSSGTTTKNNNQNSCKYFSLSFDQYTPKKKFSMFQYQQ